MDTGTTKAAFGGKRRIAVIGSGIAGDYSRRQGGATPSCFDAGAEEVSDLDEARLEDAAFTLFLHARMLGCAAEIDDHLNRGRNMDTRTPASKCRHVS